jgi:hypothetical protein
MDDGLVSGDVRAEEEHQPEAGSDERQHEVTE